MDVIRLTYSEYDSDLVDRIRMLPGFYWLDGFYAQPNYQALEIIAAIPDWTIRQENQGYFLYRGDLLEEVSDPINTAETLYLQEKKDRCSIPSQSHATSDKQLTSALKIFDAGLLGYLSYEFCKSYTLEAEPTENTESVPSIYLGSYRNFLLVDHSKKELLMVSNNEKFRQAVLSQSTEGSRTTDADRSRNFILSKPFTGDMPKDKYNAAFNRIREYIAAGDCYQVNLTQRFSSSYQGDPFDAYKTVREKAKAPFSAFIDTGSGAILSFSPERFISINDGKVESKPIKGTRPRSPSADLDLFLGNQLVTSDKDRAENVMIVDLLRNDLGKFAKLGSVQVPELCKLESFSNVHHLVSKITAELRKDVHPLRFLVDSSPGGSITGAPKIRAMQIIEELELHSRSIYCGSLFYLSFSGNLDSSIAIRTLTCKDGVIHCWGGGGIVADSDCEDEHQESITKIRHITETLESKFLKY